MRGLTACLVGFLGLGALATMAACSDSTDSSSGGSGGAGATAGSGGKAGSAGSPSAAGDSNAGAAGSAECGFATDACNTCITDNCAEQTNACAQSDSCISDLFALPNCVCDPSKDADTCVGKFVTDNGDVGEKLANCYSLNCADVCQ